jgi:hypothetical protein
MNMTITGLYFNKLCRYLSRFFNWNLFLIIIGLLLTGILSWICLPDSYIIIPELLLAFGICLGVFLYFSFLAFYLFQYMDLYEESINGYFNSRGLSCNGIEFVSDKYHELVKNDDDWFYKYFMMKSGGLIMINSSIYRKAVLEKDGESKGVFLRADFSFNKIKKIELVKMVRD